MPGKQIFRRSGGDLDVFFDVGTFGDYEAFGVTDGGSDPSPEYEIFIVDTGRDVRSPLSEGLLGSVFIMGVLRCA